MFRVQFWGSQFLSESIVCGDVPCAMCGDVPILTACLRCLRRCAMNFVLILTVFCGVCGDSPKPHPQPLTARTPANAKTQTDTQTRKTFCNTKEKHKLKWRSAHVPQLSQFKVKRIVATTNNSRNKNKKWTAETKLKKTDTTDSKMLVLYVSYICLIYVL